MEDEIMKKYILFAVGFIVIFLTYQLYPIKFTVNEDTLSNKNYILVASCATTLSNWKIINNEQIKSDDDIYVRLEGNAPVNLNYNILSGNNIYVCYGEFLEDGNLMGETYKRFSVENWDILYPVSRNSVFDFILPDNYICNLDLE